MGQLMCNIDHTDDCQQAAEAATQLERERIIKLLEDFAKNYKGDKEEMELWFPDDYFGVWIAPEIIALIKGEK